MTRTWAAICVVLGLALQGCTSTKFMGTSGAEFGGGYAEAVRNPEVYLEFEYSGFGAQSTNKRWTQKNAAMLGDALEDEGLSIIGEGWNPEGMSIDVSSNTTMSIHGGFFAMYMLSLGILPGRNDFTDTFTVTFQDRDQRLREVEYEAKYVRYLTVFSPIALFLGNRDQTVRRQIYTSLAEEIIEDFPASSGGYMRQRTYETLDPDRGDEDDD